jgi:hypothetical protein
MICVGDHGRLLSAILVLLPVGFVIVLASFTCTSHLLVRLCVGVHIDPIDTGKATSAMLSLWPPRNIEHRHCGGGEC